MTRFAFSNFQPASVVCDLGITYPTVEHAFQAAKTLDRAERRAIASLATPGKAKRAGRRVTPRPDWEARKLVVMLDLLRQKYRAGST